MRVLARVLDTGPILSVHILDWHRAWGEETDLGSHDARIHSREHVESKGGGFSSTRLTLTDEISGTGMISIRISRCMMKTYGLMRSIGNAFSWIFDGFLNLAA